MKRKVKVFIASMSKRLPIARAVQKALTGVSEPGVWDQGATFQLNLNNVDSLLRRLREVDFAVFVYTADDPTAINGKPQLAARDNVTFELGLFMGRLGRERCFILKPSDVDMRIPTDLVGPNYAEFDMRHAESEPDEAIGTAMRDICTVIERQGAFSPIEAHPPIDASAMQRQTTVDVSRLTGLWLSRFVGPKKVVQYDLEMVWKEGSRTLIGKNVLAAGLGENLFLHELEFEIHANQVLGRWYDIGNTYLGTVQLAIHSDLKVMRGSFTGNASDNSIRTGKWDWIRVDAKEESMNDVHQLIERLQKEDKLLEHTRLEQLFKDGLKAGRLLKLNGIIEKKDMGPRASSAH